MSHHLVIESVREKLETFHDLSQELRHIVLVLCDEVEYLDESLGTIRTLVSKAYVTSEDARTEMARAFCAIDAIRSHREKRGGLTFERVKKDG